MTKLEELKAARDAARIEELKAAYWAACDAAEAAYYTARDAVGPDGADIWDAAAWLAHADAACDAAEDAVGPDNTEYADYVAAWAAHAEADAWDVYWADYDAAQAAVAAYIAARADAWNDYRAGLKVQEEKQNDLL
jgi:hypothetical protein